jgi:hypothetical protein
LEGDGGIFLSTAFVGRETENTHNVQFGASQYFGLDLINNNYADIV